MTMTPTQIQDRIDERKAATPEATTYQHIKPFASAAEDLIDTVLNEDGRWMFGVQEIDACIRGVGPSELMYVTGRAHSGKTQLVLQSIVNNPNANVIIFTPDEVDALILTKLIGITRGWNAELLEEKVKAEDPDAMDMVRRVASEEFKNLIVIDNTLSFTEMSQAMSEAEDYWGGGADVVVIDFLELLPGEAEHGGVTWKSQTLKRWTKHHEVPVVCLHQASRSSGGLGKSAGMSAMRYGGETEALFVLEVFRKRDDKDLDEYERQRHQTTISVAVVKNKRPPSRLGEWDLLIDPENGAVRSLKLGDQLVSSAPPRNAAEAMDQRAQRRAQ
jgi:replicative DNA helicase